MIIDLNALDDGTTIEADVAIIGGGAAGIALSLQMLGSGVDVAMVESGGLDYEAETQALYEGDITGLDYFPLDSARLRFLGGSTNHWGGQSLPLEALDFTERDWVPDSGWPVSFEEYLRYLPRAEPFCRLTVAEAGPAVWKVGADMPDFPFDETAFQPTMVRYPEAGFSFGSLHRRTLERAERVTCYLHANAVGFDTGPMRRGIEGVRLASLDGRRATLRARTYVLATGGIENCRLLLAAGLGNDNDLVGRYAMEHPNYDTGPVLISESQWFANAIRKVDSQVVRLDTRLDAAAQAEARILNHSAFLLRRPEPRQGRVARLWDRLSDRFTGPEMASFDLRVRLEHAPRPESRITLTDATDALGMPRVAFHYQVGDLESRTLAHVCDEFARAVGVADIGRMKVDADLGSWTESMDWQYHHCGGTRMHADPRKGVVDADCKVHGIDNLYVAGSSIFPTSGQANPTMNLLAFTVRLSDHLKAGMRA